jgi:hypothetical protein
MKHCPSCRDLLLNRENGGNNDILSLFLIKYNLKEMTQFLSIIHKILTHETDLIFDRQYESDNFSFFENGETISLNDYIEKTIQNSNDYLNLNQIDNDYENSLYYLQKSLFIISFIKNFKIRLFILGEHSYFEKLNTYTPTSPYITRFIRQCEYLINDYQNIELNIELNHIGLCATHEWIEIGLYWFK